MTVAADATTPVPEPTMGAMQRVVAVFTRPGSAWAGLRERAGWWVPLLISTLMLWAFIALLYDRAIVPVQLAGMDQQVADGRMPPEAAQRAEAFISSPAGMMIGMTFQTLFLWVLTFFAALLTWLGVAFILGHRFKYRLALEVVAWSGLVLIPGQIVAGVLAWVTENVQSVHLGLGALVPQGDPPGGLTLGLATFLDAIGPFGIWYLVVGVLGASALSGAPRRNTAWVLGGIYLVTWAIVGALVAVLTPGG